MELAMQLISTDQTVRNDTIQDLKILTSNHYQLKLKKVSS